MVTRFRIGTNRPTKRLNLHVSSVSPLPKSYRDAFSDPNWQNAMRDEYHALIKNKTWTLIARPPNTNIVRCMWLFRHKYLADGTLSRYKARLVANGSTKLEGVDVDETFSPVVKPGLFLSQKKYAIELLDRAHMVNCNPSRTSIDTESKMGSDGDLVFDPTLYRSLAGSLQYLTFTRPYISYAVQFGLHISDVDWSGVASTTRTLNCRGQIIVVCADALRDLLVTQIMLSCTLLSSATLVFTVVMLVKLYVLQFRFHHQCTKNIEIDIHFVRDLVAAG
ncbi:ribonuclease H-like domain-containing protein [Tanacetum coccineum]